MYAGWGTTYFIQSGCSSPHLILRFLHGLYTSQLMLPSRAGPRVLTHQQPFRLRLFGSGAPSFFGRGIACHQAGPLRDLRVSGVLPQPGINCKVEWLDGWRYDPRFGLTRVWSGLCTRRIQLNRFAFASTNAITDRLRCAPIDRGGRAAI